MSEYSEIQEALAHKARKAYEMAKKNNNAYIVIGDGIYKVYSDDRKELIKTLPQVMIKTSVKEIRIE